MELFHLETLDVPLVQAGIIAECCSFLLYRRFQIRTKRLCGTGRMTDIEIARNWQRVFSTVMIAVPVLFYLLKSAILPE